MLPYCLTFQLTCLPFVLNKEETLQEKSEKNKQDDHAELDFQSMYPTCTWDCPLNCMQVLICTRYVVWK